MAEKQCPPLASKDYQLRSYFQFNHFAVYCSLLRKRVHVENKHVLVIGSETPWIEAILLELGAKHVTTMGN